MCWHLGITELSVNDSGCFIPYRKDVIGSQLCVIMGVRLVASVPPLRTIAWCVAELFQHVSGRQRIPVRTTHNEVVP